MLPPQRLTPEQPDMKASGQGALCASLTECLALSTEVPARPISPSPKVWLWGIPRLEGVAVGHPEAGTAVKHLPFPISVGQETEPGIWHLALSFLSLLF